MKCVQCDQPGTRTYSTGAGFTNYCAEHWPFYGMSESTMEAITKADVMWLLDTLWDHAELPLYAVEQLIMECPYGTLKALLTDWLKG